MGKKAKKKSKYSDCGCQKREEGVKKRPKALSLLIPAQDHFPGLTGTHCVKALLELINGESMSDNRGQIQTRLDQRRHLVPGFKHLTAIDAFDEQPLEDDFVPG